MKKLIFIFVLVLMIATAALAQGNSFNFQGRLNDGTNPANGQYDLQFGLFNAITGGTQIGSTVPRPATVLINGVFSVTLDFGASAFNNPNSVFIEIGVKPGGSPNAYTVLGPRQQLTVVPFAVRAASAANADNATTLNGYNDSNFIRNSAFPQADAYFNIGGVGTIGTRLVVNGDSVVLGLHSAARLNAGTTTITGPTTISGTTTITGPTAINNSLNVQGEVTVNSALRLGNDIIAGGNALQSRDKSGYPKVLLQVDRSGTILRCHNGIFGNPPPTCGFAVSRIVKGLYKVSFTFPVDDLFAFVTLAGSTEQDFVYFTQNTPTEISVKTYSFDALGNKYPEDLSFLYFVF